MNEMAVSVGYSLIIVHDLPSVAVIMRPSLKKFKPFIPPSLYLTRSPARFSSLLKTCQRRRATGQSIQLYLSELEARPNFAKTQTRFNFNLPADYQGQNSNEN